MKNIIYGSGIVTILTTLVFMLLGKIDISTGIMIDTTVLGILYGWYQKIEKEDIEEDHLFTLLNLKEQKRQYDVLLHESVINQHLLNDLQLENRINKQIAKDVIETPVKKSRVRKPKVDKK